MEQIILTETEFNKLKIEVKKHKDKEIIFTSINDDLNRKVMEKLPIQIILIPLEDRKDYMKQRDSGLNEIIARIAKKNNIKIGINLDEIINSKNKERLLGRIKQNIMLCNKNKIKITFIQNKHKKSEKDLKALLITLGLHTSLC
jgi:RNase P/RNase MRP subunit p30